MTLSSPRRTLLHRRPPAHPSPVRDPKETRYSPGRRHSSCRPYSHESPSPVSCLVPWSVDSWTRGTRGFPSTLFHWVDPTSRPTSQLVWTFPSRHWSSREDPCHPLTRNSYPRQRKEVPHPLSHLCWRVGRDPKDSESKPANTPVFGSHTGLNGGLVSSRHDPWSEPRVRSTGTHSSPSPPRNISSLSPSSGPVSDPYKRGRECKDSPRHLHLGISGEGSLRGGGTGTGSF